jgi:nucleoside-diphosphate-sugar epimerase
VLSLVTGGAGFLGSHLVDALLAKGENVVIVDNMSTGSLRNIDPALRTGRATFLYLDVGKPLSEIREAFIKAARSKRFNQIFHLASPPRLGAPERSPWEALSANAVGTMALIDFAIEQRARLIYASSSEIYGSPTAFPIAESHVGNVDPIGPSACYDEGKRFGEAALSVAVERRGLDARIVRFFDCYGPRMGNSRARFVSDLADAVVTGRPLPIRGDGRQKRSLMFVADAIRVVLLVAEAPLLGLAPVNVGSEQEWTAFEIAEISARVAGIPFVVECVDAQPEDFGRRLPDISRAISLGFTPQTTLDAGLEETFDYVRDSGGIYV